MYALALAIRICATVTAMIRYNRCRVRAMNHIFVVRSSTPQCDPTRLLLCSRSSASARPRSKEIRSSLIWRSVSRSTAPAAPGREVQSTPMEGAWSSGSSVWSLRNSSVLSFSGRRKFDLVLATEELFFVVLFEVFNQGCMVCTEIVSQVPPDDFVCSESMQ